MTFLDNWDTKYRAERPRRLLTFDGGGIRGIISLEIARKIEMQLAAQTGEGAAFRLGKYFDYIGGTSTGAIIAAGLAAGKTVDELVAFYRVAGPMMFQKEWLLSRLRSFYAADPLREKLKEVLGDRTLGATDLRCLLLIVTRNATTDSPWPLSNNPFAKYNARDRADCNLNIPLWQLVRASTAAPVYFPPEILEWDKKAPAKSFYFVDGGVTPYNNPAFLMFRLATSPQYRLAWPSGERKMMLISVGTGSARHPDKDLDARGQLVTGNLSRLPGVLMGGSAIDQDINCRTIGRCVFGHPVDRELGDMIPRRSDPLEGDVIPLEEDCGRQFLYARYNPNTDAEGLAALGLARLNPDDVQSLDGVGHLDEMQEIGRAYAEKFVDMSPFERFSDSLIA